MSRIIFLAIVFLAAGIIFAEEKKDDSAGNEPKKTEEKAAEQGKKNEDLAQEGMSHGGYGAVYAKGTQLTKSFGMLLGARAMYILDHHYSAGLTLNWLVNNTADANDPLRNGFSFGYGGIVLEYIYHPVWKFIGVSGGILLGAGSMKVKIVSQTTFEKEDKILVFEPEVNVIFSVYKIFRISLGFGYRLIALNDYAPIPASELMGVTGNIMFRFGEY